MVFRRLWGVSGVLVALVFGAGCTKPTAVRSNYSELRNGASGATNRSESSDQGKSEPGKPEQPAKVRVAASFYPLVFLAERVGGDWVSVANITPPGVEPHDVELSPEQASQIEDAQLVITLGRGFQPSVEKAAERRPIGVLSVLDRLVIDGMPQAGLVDPHIWLDPVTMQMMAYDVAQGLTQIDPVHGDMYRANATKLSNDLATLDAELRGGLSKCKRTTLVTSHASFGWFVDRYGLTAQAIAGFAPDIEPTANQLAELADLVKSTGTTTIFTEEAVSPDIAETLARETGAATAVLSPLELKPKEGDFLSAMRTNLSVLQKGLECAG
jgi:zinc transport system substrate-binding protein